jgi:drug/metabolite transporter (DMT)-like permease
MLNKHISSSFIGAFYVFLGAIMFAGKAVIVKYLYMHHEIDKVSMLTLRMVFSMPFYAAILLWNLKTNKKIVTLTTKDWLWMVAIGLLGYYLASYFDFWGLQYITAGIERLVLFVYPTLVVLIGAIFLKKKINNIQKIALVVTYLGLFVAFIPDIQIGLQKNMVFGSFLIFLSALTYALYLIGNGEMVKKIGSLLFTCYALLISTAMVIIHYYVSIGHGIFDFPKQIYVLSLIMAVFCTVIPSFLISDGIKRIGAGNTAIIGSVGPVATIFMASYFLDESFSGWQIVGTIFVLMGVLMISLKGNETKTIEKSSL